jgi:integrase
MARRSIHRLASREVATLTKPGRHADGGNLYLVIRPDGSRRWSFLFRDRRNGRLREMGLGAAVGPKKAGVGLQEARRKAEAARGALYAGNDPISDRREQKAATLASTVTFGQVADDVFTAISPGFKNEKHRDQWKSSLAIYAAPLWSMLVKDIDTDAILKVLRPIWQTKHDTAVRVRGRIEHVLDAAKVRNLRTGDNPARWRGHLDKLLSKRNATKRNHFAAIPYGEMAALVRDVRAKGSVSAFALEFCILTATRTNEVIGAKWNEIDLSKKVWTIPGVRMKSGFEFRVPLTDRAVDVLKKLRPAGVEVAPASYVFPGRKTDAPLSNMAMLKVLRDLRGQGSTVHGTARSSFKDWAAETTNHANIVSEMALSHAIGSETEEAYRRGDLFQKRRKLMEDWSRFLSRESARVVEIDRNAR